MQQTIVIPSDHPSLPGHFPGRPIVPGAVILTEIAYAAVATFGAARVAAFPTVKFLSPMLPQQHCVLTLTDKGNGNAVFELVDGARRIVSGRLRYEMPTAQQSAER